MYVLGMAGSPRRGGNTELLLDQALAGAASQGARTEKIVLSDLTVKPCRHCQGCGQTGICIVADEMREIHQKLRQADFLILAAPIFFLGLPAETKIVIDRCQAFWVARYVLKQRHTHGEAGQRRRALFISTGGMNKPSIFDGAVATARAFFSSADFAFDGALLYPGIEERGDIKKHPTALHDAFEAGVKLVSPRQEAG